MTKRTGAGVTSLFAILLAFTLTPGGSASARAAGAAVAAPQAQANDISARRHQRPRYRGVSQHSYPSYYGRPHYYAPAPFFPIPPFFGYGWEPW
jgi:outer membrane lipoprotein-sorting protein